jgi:hypothetical protein
VATVAFFLLIVFPLRRTAGAAEFAYSAGEAAGIGQGPAEQVLDLGVGAAQVVGRPAGQRVVHHGIQPEQDLLAFDSHDYW